MRALQGFLQYVNVRDTLQLSSGHNTKLDDLKGHAIPHYGSTYLTTDQLKSFNVVLLPELMQRKGVGYFVCVWPSNFFDHALKKSIRSLQISSLTKMCFQWKTLERAANVTFMHFLRGFSCMLFSLEFYLYTCSIEKQH